jgi:hypothetical protein
VRSNSSPDFPVGNGGFQQQVMNGGIATITAERYAPK